MTQLPKTPGPTIEAALMDLDKATSDLNTDPGDPLHHAFSVLSVALRATAIAASSTQKNLAQTVATEVFMVMDRMVEERTKASTSRLVTWCSAAALGAFALGLVGGWLL